MLFFARSLVYMCLKHKSFYFRLLIAHLPCPSSTHSSWYPHRAGRAVGVERSGKRDLGWQAGWLAVLVPRS